MQKLKNKAFTLVELIVVITILTILGTIAFISLQGYSTNARDSTRISDMSSMKSSLELFHLDAGKYPTPTNGVNITFSGGTVWTQGSFGESVISNIDKLNKIPTDPLTDKEYTYSITSSKNEYELGGMVEGDIMTSINTTTKANAGDTEASAIVTGNYNGSITKTLSGTLCNILAVPTIITNDTETSTDLVHIVSSGALVYNGYKNLPATFRTSKFKVDGGFDFVPNNLAVYSDTNSCNPLIDKTSTTARVQMLKGIQNAYSGTIVKTQGEIKNIIALVIDTNAPSNEVINYAGSFVNNNLGGKVQVNGGGNNNGGNTNTTTLTCEEVITQAKADELNALFLNGDIYPYGDLAMTIAYDSGVDYPLSINQWCNDIVMIDYGTQNAINSGLVASYNAMNSLDEIYYLNADLSTQISYLSQMDDLVLKQDGLTVSYNSAVFTMSKLKGLDLTNFGLTSIPSTIGNLTNLRYLTLDSNSLSVLPTQITNLTNLKNLGISANSFTGPLQSEIFSLTGLTALAFSDNPGVTIPTSIGNLTNLIYLTFNNNGIGTLPQEIGSLTNLQFLDAYGNSFSSLPTQIGNLVNLKSLSLGGNTSLISLPTELGNLSVLGFLGLSGNTGLGNLNSNFTAHFNKTLTQGGMTITTTVGGNYVTITGTF